MEKGKELLEKERFNLKSAIEAGKEAYQKQKGKKEEAEKSGAAGEKPGATSEPAS